MAHSCGFSNWECPSCNGNNSEYISASTIVNCDNCNESLSWDGNKVVTYEEWLRK